MHWLLRLFTRDAPPAPAKIAELAALAVGEAVEVCGEAEVEVDAEVLRSPLDGEPAIALHYMMEVLAHTDQHPVFHEHYQGASFLLRDETGVARVELEPGRDVAEIHRYLVGAYGAGNRINVERMAPGDRLRVRGRVREPADAGVACTIWADVIEHAER